MHPSDPPSYPPPLPSQPARPAYTEPELDAIAWWTRTLNLCVLVVLIAVFVLMPLDLTIVAVLIAAVAQLAGVYGLASAMKSKAAVVWALVSIVPYIGLIPLLIVSSRSSSLLRRHGYKVGFLGARRPH